MVKELKKSVNFISEKYDEMEKKNKEIFTLMKNIKKEKEEIKLENELLKKEVMKFKKDINFLTTKLNNEDQNKLINNIEIKGVQNKEIQNDEDVTKQILTKIGVNIKKDDILIIERKKFNKEGNNNTIQIKCKNHNIKEDILKKNKTYFKKNGKIRNIDVKLPGPETNIYINEHLTVRNKYLLGKAKELRKFNYKFIWYKNGTIFVRRNEEEKIVQITNEEQIEKLKKGGTSYI